MLKDIPMTDISIHHVLSYKMGKREKVRGKACTDHDTVTLKVITETDSFDITMFMPLTTKDKAISHPSGTLYI